MKEAAAHVSAAASRRDRVGAMGIAHQGKGRIAARIGDSRIMKLMTAPQIAAPPQRPVFQQFRFTIA